jgi:anthranilate phosphoribosyltransferase
MKLEVLLKKKGIGPEGSKSLNAEECDHVFQMLTHTNQSLTTQATMLVALFSLQANEFEKSLIQKIKDNLLSVPTPIQFLASFIGETIIENNIIKNIQGQSLNYSEAYQTFDELVKNNHQTPYLLAAFLEAQRLKRESTEENQAFFDWMFQHSNRIQTDLPILIDIADNYDGYSRYANTSLMVAAIVAAYGLPCLLHSSDTIAPKFGITTAQIIQYLGGNTNKTLNEVTEQLKNSEIQWGFVHQKNFNHLIYNLAQTRTEMVKRPCLATFEKFCQPIRAIDGNSIYGGFTHAHFKNEIPLQLRQQNKVKEAYITKGLEGSTAIATTRSSICMHVKNNIITETLIDPLLYFETYKIQPMTQSLSFEEVLQKSIAAIKGVKNEIYDQMSIQAAFILANHTQLCAKEAYDTVENIIQNQTAYRVLMKGL